MFSRSVPDHTTLEDAGTAEERMRRALGIGGTPPARTAAPPQQRPEPSRPRHRFVRDGEVPVEAVSHTRAPDAAPAGRVASLQAALDGERAARTAAERALAEARAAVQALRTKLAHAELAHEEALAAEHRAREGLEAELREAVAARGRAEYRLGRATRAAEVAPTPKRARSVRPTPKIPAAAGAREPEPVQWWLPNHKAAAKAR